MLQTRISTTADIPRQRELWQLAFKMPALLGSDAAQLTVPDEDACWGIKLSSRQSLIGCDFAAEAERLDRFLTGAAG